MKIQELPLGITLDERVQEQLFDGSVQQEWVSCHGLQFGCEFGCSLDDDLLGDRIGSEKRATAQQVSCSRVGAVPPSRTRGTRW